MPRYAIVEAPSALGHVPEHLGVERAPEVLLGAGLADGLAARRAGRIEAAGYSADRDRVRLLGAGAAAREAVRYLTRDGRVRRVVPRFRSRPEQRPQVIEPVE